MLSAETLASALPKGRQLRGGKFLACCPAHEDKTPSLSISEVNGKTLFHCFAGCSQGEVISALANAGLWRDEHPQRPFFSKDELEYMLHFCLLWNSHVRKGLYVSERDTNRMQRYVTALSEFYPTGYRVVEEDACGC